MVRALEINSYSNPNRSSILSHVLDELRYQVPDKTWEGNHPKWHETAAKMRPIATAVMVLGVGVTVGSVIVACLLSTPNLSLTIGLVGGAGGITILVIGIYLKKKDYWIDPAYNQERREEIIEAYLTTKDTPEFLRQVKAYPTLFDKKEVGSLFCEVYPSQRHTYYDLLCNPNSALNAMIEGGESAYLPPKKLMFKLLEEIRTFHPKVILSYYGWQPFEYEVLSDRFLLQENEQARSGFEDIDKRRDFNALKEKFRQAFLGECAIYIAAQGFQIAYSTFDKAFGYGLIDTRDTEVIAHYNKYINAKANFTEIPSDLLALGVEHNWRPESDRELFKTLYTEWQKAQTTKQRAEESAIVEYETAKRNATGEYDSKANERHPFRIGFHNFSRAQAEKTYHQAIHNAEEAKTEAHQAAQRAFDSAKAQIDQQWRLINSSESSQ